LKASDPEQIRDLYIIHYTVRYLITDEIIYKLRDWHNKENEKIYYKVLHSDKSLAALVICLCVQRQCYQNLL
jgi:hypothetical protein